MVGGGAWPVWLALGLSLMSPFIRDLEIERNPIIIFIGSSGCGKTTLTDWATGVWGNSKVPFKIEGSQSPTIIGFSQNLMPGIPILIDEVQKMPTEKKGNQATFEGMVYILANGVPRLTGRPDGNVRYGKDVSGVLFAAGEVLPLMKGKGAYNRIGIIDANISPPLGIGNIPKTKEGNDRALLLTTIRKDGYGHFGSQLYQHLKKVVPTIKDNAFPLSREDLYSKMGYYGHTIAALSLVLKEMFSILEINDLTIIDNVVDKSAAMLMAYQSGNDSDPDVVAFERLRTMLGAGQEITTGSGEYINGTGMYKIGAEIAFWEKDVNGIDYWIIPPKARAFKEYVKEDFSRFAAAWKELGLIECDGSGKSTRMARPLNGGPAIRCIFIRKII